MADQEKEYMTPAEAARTLYVSPKTVNRWAKEGRLECIVTLGGHRRFRRDSVVAAAEAMAAGGVEQRSDERKG